MKKTLALILGILMLMGCLSVSAANSALDVDVIDHMVEYDDDFTSTNQNARIVLRGDAVYDSTNGVISSPGTQANSGAAIYFNPDQSGVTGTIILEYTLNSKVSDWENYNGQLLNQIEGTGSLHDLRWYGGGGDNGNPKFAAVQGSADGQYYPLYYGTESISVRTEYNIDEGTYCLWIGGNSVFENETVRDPGTDAKYIALVGNQKMIFSIENFKWYYKDKAPVAGMPVVGEEIYRQTFDGVTMDSSMVNNYAASDVTVAQANGALSLGCSTSVKEKGALVYLQPNQEKITGQYVMEMVLANPSYGSSASSNGYHRISFGVSDCYLNWCPGKQLQYRFYGETDPYVYLTERMEELNANGTTLKVTHLYDTDASSVKVWINDVFAYERTGIKAGYASFNGIYFNLYYGSVELVDLRVYRPATFDANTGLSIAEDANTLEIATNAAKAGRLYFATYEGEGDATTLDALGTAALSLEPGKVYKVSKADWEGAKAFFWDNDQKPIVDSWDLQ